MIRFVLKTFLALALIGLCCLTYGLLVEPKTLEVRGPELISNKYSGPPLRIGVITDIHIGGLHVPAARVQKLVADMNSLNPDIILLPGDFVDGHVPSKQRSAAFNANLEAGIKYLSDLKAPSFATIGNHDAWYGATEITNMLQASGISVLENDSAIFRDVCLVGLADAMTASPNGTAYENCPSTFQPIVFTHSPEAWPAFRKDSVLAIAGHTHGGQVNLPIIGRRVNATSLSAEHSYGFSKLADIDVFVSAGVGTSILPVRFRASPEIVILTVKSSG